MGSRRRSIVIRNRYFVASDLVLIALSAVLSFAIRLDIPLFWSYIGFSLIFAFICTVIKFPLFYLFGLYSRYWRYASVHEMLTIVAANTAASLAIAVLTLGIFIPSGWLAHFPRSVLVIDWLLSLFFVGGIRFSARFMGEFGMLRGTNGRMATAMPKRVLIVGAGDAGAMIAREMRNNPGIGLDPVGYVDDNEAKVGMRIRDLPVLGTRESIPRLVRDLKIHEVLIAMPTAPGRAIREIREICESTPVAFKTIPGMYELLNGQITASQIRDIQIEDLLRRDSVRIKANDAAYVHNQTVLVTGAGGSIGSELCRQVAHRSPRHIILLGHGETSIYHIYNELQTRFPGLAVTPAIADVRDKARILRIVQKHKPQVIIHAAAHKHVPLMEQNVEEAVTNNVLGTQNVLEVAEQAGVKRFVLISTDKAVNPINIMGATKRIAELMVQDAARRSGNNYVAVRFGNVLGSRGSVVPLFKQQIAAGGPVTVTHPEMERYFMTIPEAVYLVLQAASLGSGGELFVLDMGEPVKIVDLARDLITLSGLQPDRDIEIKFTGVRPGEKLHERLFLRGEDYETTKHEKIFVVGHVSALSGGALHHAVQRLIRQSQQGAPPSDIWSSIKAIVPECEVTLGAEPAPKPGQAQDELYGTIHVATAP